MGSRICCKPAHYEPIQAIRFDDWKAVRNGPKAAMELYDLKADAGEKNNIAAAHPDLVAKADALIKGARVDVPGFRFVEGGGKPKPKGKGKAKQ